MANLHRKPFKTLFESLKLNYADSSKEDRKQILKKLNVSLATSENESYHCAADGFLMWVDDFEKGKATSETDLHPYMVKSFNK